jgi:predicted unusual protein kinase regulating ubiquinone biosynthesis (AarF/ABC1/UbiB family)
MMEAYGDLLFDMPFQLQVDLLFVVRGVEILNGVATNLNPTFNTWQALIPFAQDLARREVKEGGKQWWKETSDLVRLALELPKRADRVLQQAERGKLTVRYSFAKDARARIDRLEKRMARQERTMLMVGFLLAGTYAKVQGNPGQLGDIFLGLAGLVLIWRLIK